MDRIAKKDSLSVPERYVLFINLIFCFPKTTTCSPSRISQLAMGLYAIQQIRWGGDSHGALGIIS